jgi:Domain of unknown function (DUF4258)
VIRYSDHAERQMARRGITEDDVSQALRQRVNTTPGDSGTVWIHGYTPGGRILKVCVDLHDREFVITAAWPRPRG